VKEGVSTAAINPKAKNKLPTQIHRQQEERARSRGAIPNSPRMEETAVLHFCKQAQKNFFVATKKDYSSLVHSAKRMLYVTANAIV